MQEKDVLLLEQVLHEVRALRKEVAELRALSSGARHIQPASEPLPNFKQKAAYTYQEAATIWGIGYRTVQGYVASRIVLTINRGGPRIPHDELMRVWHKGVKKGKRRRRS